MVKISLLAFFIFSVTFSWRLLHVQVKRLGGWGEVINSDPVIKDALILTGAILAVIFTTIVIFG